MKCAVMSAERLVILHESADPGEARMGTEEEEGALLGIAEAPAMDAEAPDVATLPDAEVCHLPRVEGAQADLHLDAAVPLPETNGEVKVGVEAGAEVETGV